MEMEKENSNDIGISVFKITPEKVSEDAMTDFLLNKIWSSPLPKISLSLSKLSAKFRILMYKNDDDHYEYFTKRWKKLKHFSYFAFPVLLTYSIIFSLFQTYSNSVALGICTMIWLAIDLTIFIANLLSGDNPFTATTFIFYKAWSFLKNIGTHTLTLFSQIPLALYFWRFKKDEIIKLLFLIRDKKNYDSYYHISTPDNYSNSLSANNQETLDEHLYAMNVGRNKASLILDSTNIISLLKQDEVIFEHYQKKKKKSQIEEELAYKIKNEMQNDMQTTLQKLYEKV